MSFFYRTILFLTFCFFKIFYRHRVYGKEHYFSGGAIIAANHTSFLDPPIVAISCPEEIHFLARRSLFKPLFGRLIRALNTHPVEKGESNIAVMKQICAMLVDKKKVLLFPEGTRSRDGVLGEIKPGFGLLLAKAKSAILPVYVHGTFAIWSCARKFPRLWGRTACVFGSPILWEDYSDMDQKEALALITQRLIHSFNELKKWYEEGAEGIPP
jgi:1-acyl-sn-glycerol-3-phosphate acyltransferase